MIPLLTLCLLSPQDSEALRVEDLLAPDVAVEKIAGDMRFTEGPVWLSEAKKLVCTCAWEMSLFCIFRE